MGHGGISGNGLLIDKGELTAGVLEQKLALDRVYRGEDVGEQNSCPEQQEVSVVMNEDGPVGSQKAEFAQQPKA